MNKKILAILMAILMVLASVAAFAEAEVVEETTFELSKTYIGDGRDAETFTFTIVNAEGNNGPALTFANNANTLAFAADNIASATDDNIAQTLTINVPAVGENGYEAKPGTYTYILTETAGSNEDITYDGTVWLVKVTVYNAAAAGADPDYKTTLSIRENTADGTKNDTADFENTYEAANTLKVKKQITGNMAVSTDTFTIQVTITDENGAELVLATPIVPTPSDTTVTVDYLGDGVYEIKNIGHNDVVTFTNLPQGAKYTVVETETNGYEDSYDANQDGVVTKNQEIETVVTNTKNETIDTGVTTDNMPYIMLMAFAMMIAAAVVLKKRTVNE